MMGPSWDFDISSGNGDYYDYTYQNYWVDYNPWFYKLIQKDSFEARFIARFNDIMNNHFDAFIAEIDYVSGQLYPHAIRNFEKWEYPRHLCLAKPARNGRSQYIFQTNQLFKDVFNDA